MANELTEFLIQKETLEAAADSIRGYLKETSLIFIPPITPGWLKTGITKHFWEEVDVEVGETSNRTKSTTDSDFNAAGYEKNNEGLLVPVLYAFTNVEGERLIDRYFYVGVGKIDEISYDKWRKIEANSSYTWTSETASYVYTDIVVMTGNNAEAKINPTDFPEKIAEVYAAGIAAASTYENANEEVY